MVIKLFKRRSCGLTLIECLIVLALMLLIIGALVEISRICRHFFFKLKESQEFIQEIWAGQDRIRRDLNKAGVGLEPCLASGLLLAIESKGSGLYIYSREASFQLNNEVEAGSIIIPVSHNNSISRGQLVALIDVDKAEIFKVGKVEKDRLFLNQPTRESYSTDSYLLAIEEVFYYYDEGNQTLRRRVNASSGQPFLERVNHFSFSIDNRGLTKITLIFKLEKEITYEIRALPKNALIAQGNFY